MIISANHPNYRMRLNNLSVPNRYNGAFYYSKEIKANIIPYIETDRHWILVDAGVCSNHAIVFIHDNKTTEHTYDWLKNYDDLILVCGVPETMEKVEHLGKPVYLPLSVDVKYVEQFKAEKKTREMAFAGRPGKKANARLPYDCPTLTNMPRERLLPTMAQFKKIFAVGRTAIEAKVLGCEIGAYDPRFPDPERWQVLDNADVVPILQELLDAEDNQGKENE